MHVLCRDVTCASSQELLKYWCVEQGKAGSAKCKQMEFGKKMQDTDSGEERKRIASEFNSATTDADREALESETKNMMLSVCGSRHAQMPVFRNTCSKLEL